MKSLIPAYFKEFKCIGSRCEDTCCRGWNIDIDKKSYQLYKKLKHPILTETLKKNIKRNRNSKTDLRYARFTVGNNGICNLADEEGLCTIQKVLGEEFLCKTCSVYPRSYTKIDDSIEKSLTLSCPEAARLALLNPEGIDFIEEETQDFSTNQYDREMNTERHPFFWPLRMFCIEILQTQQYSIESRLILMGLFLEKTQNLKRKNIEELFSNVMQYRMRLENDNYMKQLNEIPTNDTMLLIIVNSILEVNAKIGVSNPRYKLIVSDVIKGLRLGKGLEQIHSQHNFAKENYYNSYIKEHEYILENYIVNYIFKNLFPYDGRDFLESYLKLAIHFATIKLYLQGLSIVNQRLDDVITIACIQSYEKSNMHNPYFGKEILKILKENNFYSYTHMYALIQA